MINGIKPKMTTTTKLNIKPIPFDEAMLKFCSKLEDNAKEYIEKFKHMDSVKFSVGGGRKYIRVEYFQTNLNTDYETGEVTKYQDSNGRIHCFVDSTTGDIYKPAGWRAPYTKGKNCVRGNIYDVSSYQHADLHGGWLYAR